VPFSWHFKIFINRFIHVVNLTNDGRGGKIRTCDPLVPNQMRYQAALRPEN
jgi:hypothetical protein